MKIVHSVCCGIDVHKTFIVATIGTTSHGSMTSYQTKRFSTFTRDLLAFRSWLLENNCNEVCMESTGKYWVPVYNILEGCCNIVVAHPKYVRAIKGQKTDVKDSVWICDLHKHGLVRGSFIPPQAIRDLRELLRYRTKLKRNIASEKNRIQNALTLSNIMLMSVVSKSFGVSSMSIIRHLLDHPFDKDFDVRPLLLGSMRKNADLIQQSVQGMISPAMACKIDTCLLHMKYLNDCLEKLDVKIAEITRPFSTQLRLLETVPGIGTHAAIVILAEIGADMSVFPSSRHLCSWAGLAPCNDQSANVRKSTRTAQAGSYLKPILVSCAHQAVRVKTFDHYRNRKEEISRRRGKKRANVAIARMMLSAIYHILKDNVPFDPSRYENRTTVVPSQQQLLDAYSMLTQAGYSVEATASFDPFASATGSP